MQLQCADLGEQKFGVCGDKGGVSGRNVTDKKLADTHFLKWFRSVLLNENICCVIKLKRWVYQRKLCDWGLKRNLNQLSYLAGTEKKVRGENIGEKTRTILRNFPTSINCLK